MPNKGEVLETKEDCSCGFWMHIDFTVIRDGEEKDRMLVCTPVPR